MIDDLKNLSEDERTLMYRVPLLVVVLIAGADGVIDKREIQEALNIAQIKTKKARQSLLEFYREVAVDFDIHLASYIRSAPSGVKERNEVIIAELSKLNTILPKINKVWASQFYASIRDLAKKIANASGGVLGYLAVGFEESKLIGLSMIKDPS